MIGLVSRRIASLVVASLPCIIFVGNELLNLHEISFFSLTYTILVFNMKRFPEKAYYVFRKCTFHGGFGLVGLFQLVLCFFFFFEGARDSFKGGQLNILC